ncbi:MAG: glycosyltransferase family 1 protein, partial [Armatimonadetes bacterium]|nr:glycosyltransferase family 1 protein [Armatimonadota bacterium]
MRVVHLAAGAGGMYCGACARDTLLARGLIARGHDVQILPLYTPLRFDGGDPLPTGPIFLGGINAYVEQHVPFWRWLPRPLRGLLDHPRVLTWASRFAVSTKASDLGPMMLSVLRGHRGRQAGEFADLTRYLTTTARPDLISVTNSLLTGAAPEIK